MSRNFISLGILCLFLLLSIEPIISVSSQSIGYADKPTPPLQPSDGPGGSNYSHQGVRESRYGWGNYQFWIFEPTDPVPASAPLIVFNHGWGAFYPYFYKAWVEHLVKRGNIVVYPRYQYGFIIGVRDATLHAIQSTKKAITILQTGNHVHPRVRSFRHRRSFAWRGSHCGDGSGGSSK